MTEYSRLSYDLTKRIDKKVKKDNGIYFTPPMTINKNLELLEPYMKNIKTILEPSCGSCEYVTKITQKYNVNVTCIELNKTIFESIKSMTNDSLSIYNENFLDFETKIKYDLIIGNPPYFVMKKKDVKEHYYDFFEGRPNIFIMFIIKSLSLLGEEGILSFVLPKNFLNCIYYDKTRKYIQTSFQILNLIECDDKYLETQQSTIILILKNKKVNAEENQKYCLNIEKITIFGIPEKILKIKALYNNSTTLEKIGFKVSVGNVVWNECKKMLSNDKTKTRLIYSSDIKNKKLETQNYSNTEKKNFIDKNGEIGPLLVLNRGYGVGKYNFEYCLIKDNFEYLIENHLICVRYTKKIENIELISLYEKIINSFESNRTSEFIKNYFGNNAINTRELCEIFPIYM